jgi:hypothetical protein
MSESWPLDTGNYPSFPSILVYLTLYFSVELAIKKIFCFLYPGIYYQLCRDRKDAQYFAFIMGIVITLSTTPFCITALGTSSGSSPTDFWKMSTAGQVCIASRSVLWVSELSRLDHSLAYLAHHFASIGFLVYYLQSRLPLQIIYGFYASLATELFSDTRCLLDIHGIKATTSLFAYRIQLINTILLILLRIPPIIYAASFFTSWPITGSIFWINAICLLIYSRFILNLILVGATKLKIFPFNSLRPAE